MDPRLGSQPAAKAAAIVRAGGWVGAEGPLDRTILGSLSYGGTGWRAQL